MTHGPEPEREADGGAQGASRATYDVIVYGATAGGVMAAVAAAGEGARVALLEPGRHLGGMVTGGLGWTDLGHRDVIGGAALDFYRRVGRAYGVPPFAWAGPEPHVAERIFDEWLEASTVEVIRGQRLERVEKRDAVIEALATATGESYAAAVFVDASYEGDLLAGAGVSYGVGRESTHTHGESWAGRQPWRPHKHNFDVFISPYREGGEELLPLIHDRPMVPIGEGDGGVQAYGFRLCLTRDPRRRLPFPEPAGYDPGRFELLRRYLAQKGEGVRAGQLMGLNPNLPNEKCDANSIGPISLNLLDGSNWAYPDADCGERAGIWERHLHYAQSLVFYLANDDAVPRHIRDEMAAWGLADDEFVDTGHWPHQLYVREARRMAGEYVMTQHDLQTRRRKYDSVGLGSYHIDIRSPQRSWDFVHLHPNLAPAVFNEGYVSVPVQPYEIPYRALTPQYHECENLLVPVCLSASHVAFSSIRMEPQYMILGHSAGVAASLAAREGLPVQRVPIAQLQGRLSQQDQVLSIRSVASAGGVS